MERKLRRVILFMTFRNSKRDRLPTRQPNPSVHNRNAILARENRRKKKAHLEILEKDLQEAIKTNKKLIKELSKQQKIVKRLEQEKKYYKSIITNQPKIKKLLTALNCRLDQNSKCSINFDYNQQELLQIPKGAYEDSTYSQCSSMVDEQEGRVLNSEKSDVMDVAKMSLEQDLFLSSYQSSPNIPYESFIDSEPFSLFNDCDDFYDIEGQSIMDDIIRQKDDEAVSTPLKDLYTNNGYISDEHNYVSSSDNSLKQSEKTSVGFCVHIGEHNVTLDFCLSCHLNARRASNNLYSE